MAKKIRKDFMESVLSLHAKGLTDQEIGRRLNCRGNLVNHYRHRIAKMPPNWIKIDYLSDEDKLKGYIIRNVKASAKRRGIEFNLKYTDITIVDSCPLLGIPLSYNDFLSNDNQFNSSNWATVDRFDNTKGYVRGNIWIISRLANSMKSKSTIDQLETFSRNALISIENHRALGGVTGYSEPRPLVVAPSSPSLDSLGSG